MTTGVATTVAKFVLLVVIFGERSFRESIAFGGYRDRSVVVIRRLFLQVDYADQADDCYIDSLPRGFSLGGKAFMEWRTNRPIPQRQMPSVYFDTTVYSHIEKGWIAKDVVDALQEAILSGKLSAHLSVTNIEELLGQWETDRPAAIRKLCLARDLVGFEKLLKPPNVLLEEAIRAYASETSPPSPFLPEDQCRTVVSSLRRIENGDVIIDGTVSGIVSQVGVLKQTALEQWTEGRREVHSALSPESVEARHPQRKDINWFLKLEEQAYAEGLAKTVGLGEVCQRRGLDGLVNVRPVRFFVNTVVAYVFDITIGKEVQPRAPKRGDAYDFWHVISASTADAFVSYDARLVELLTRLPIDGFRVFPSIPALLEEVV